MLVEVVQDHFGLFPALQLHYDAHTLAVAFITHVRDTLNFLQLHQLGDAFDHVRLVYLIRDLGDHNLLLFLGGALDGSLGAHGELAAPCGISGPDAALAVNVRARGKVRTGNKRENLVDRGAGLVDQQNRGIDNLRQVVGRDLGGHAHGNAV